MRAKFQIFDAPIATCRPHLPSESAMRSTIASDVAAGAAKPSQTATMKFSSLAWAMVVISGRVGQRSALNPRTGEKVQVKAGATVKFKASPSLKEAAFAGAKKAKRKGFCQRSRQNCRHSLADAVILSCYENGEGAFRATEMKHPTAVGGNMLVVTDARAEVVAELVVAATEALG